MKLFRILVERKLARSGGEATRLIKQGAVMVGGCELDCQFFATGKCSCGGWNKITDPIMEIAPGTCVKVGTGLWRCIPKLEGKGYDQVNGIARV